MATGVQGRLAMIRREYLFRTDQASTADLMEQTNSERELEEKDVIGATRRTATAAMARIFAINDDLVSRALDGLTDEQLWKRPTARTNPMLWVVGHFVQTRTDLMALLGEPIDTGWEECFVRGSALGQRDQYPSRANLQVMMSDVSRRLQANLATLDDDRLTRPPTIPSPGADTVADQVAGFALHDCYHVGQIGYIRKALGYPALAG